MKGSRNDETWVSNSGRHYGKAMKKEKASGKREGKWIKLRELWWWPKSPIVIKVESSWSQISAFAFSFAFQKFIPGFNKLIKESKLYQIFTFNYMNYIYEKRVTRPEVQKWMSMEQPWKWTQLQFFFSFSKGKKEF